MLKNRSLIFKVILGGDGAVGKTTLLHRYMEGIFLADTKMTIGVEFFQKEVFLSENIPCSLILWDFGGQKQFRRLIKSYVQGAAGALILFDLTRMQSLTSIPEWVGTFRKEDPNLPILLVGTKVDLEESFIVQDHDAEKVKEEHNFIEYIKTSSKTGLNVEKAFLTIAREIIKSRNIGLD